MFLQYLSVVQEKDSENGKGGSASATSRSSTPQPAIKSEKDGLEESLRFDFSHSLDIALVEILYRCQLVRF